MALKKSELYSSLWKSCDQLRGGMDASQYKDYVLVLLFVKYVSDKYAGSKDAMLKVPEGGGFKDMVAAKGKKDIGEKLTTIIGKLAKENKLEGVIDLTDFNDPEKLGKDKDMVDRLTNLVGIFETSGLDFRGNRADGDDLLGDAYEYLMRHFATESGKSKGQFYTPAEVSRVIAKVLDINSVKSETPSIYDPTCGSGSLLLKAHDEARSATGREFAIYGQEMDQQTSGLARMNMILHNCPEAEIWKDNVLAAPYFKDEKQKDRLKTFDFVVANPPFSFKSWSSGVNVGNDPYGRFAYGAPPAKNGDMAFLLHILASVKSTGKAAVNLPHGVLFRGNAEAAIRKEIVSRGYVKGVIGLPANLFYGTGIPACIIVLDKENAVSRKDIFMIDASKGFVKDGNKNRLQAKDIHKIVDTFTRRVEIPRYSRAVPLTEIADKKNDYNLNIPRYIDSSEPEDLQDIDGHLRGGIPIRDIDGLSEYWAVFPGVRDALIKKGDRTGYCTLAVAPAEIKSAIFGHAEFLKFKQSVDALFAKWTKANVEKLKGTAVGDRPKVLIESLSEHLLEVFLKAKLLDAYDVYQHLMTYWVDVMQDDAYAISQDGWTKAVLPRQIVEEEGKNSEKPDLTVRKKKYKMELVPPALVIARYFKKEADAITALEAERDAFGQDMEELLEEHAGEGGALEEVREEGKKPKRDDIVNAVTQLERLAIEECIPDLHSQLDSAERLLVEAETELEAVDSKMESQEVLNQLRTTRGKLTATALKKRLKVLDGKAGEEAIIRDYLEALDDVVKAQRSLSDCWEVTRIKLTELEVGDGTESSLRDLGIARRFLDLFDTEKAKSEEVKVVQAKLDAAVLAKYPELTEKEVKTLVVDDKWLATLTTDVRSELDRVSQALTGRVKQLAERYAAPLPRMTEELENLSARVATHLRKMGASWK